LSGFLFHDQAKRSVALRTNVAFFPGGTPHFFSSRHMWVEGCSSPAGWLKQASVEEGTLIAPAFTS
jgi:hypothetical protein